jgi:photosystem II stability/assembly factor-like uncharacterized protein
MTDIAGFDLERRLRNHYQTLDSGSSVRLEAQVAVALDRAPATRGGFRGLLSGRALPVVAAVVAGLALVAVVAVPLWYGHTTGPAAVEPSAAQVDESGMTRDGVLWAVRDNTLLISSDNGRTWRANDLPPASGQFVVPEGQGSLHNVFVLDAEHAWLVRQIEVATSLLFRTSNGGSDWVYAPGQFGAPASCTQVLFADAANGYVIMTPCETQGDTTPSSVQRTTDGGANWTFAGGSYRLDGLVAASDPTTLWMGASSNSTGPQPLLQVSRDGGATWQSVTLPGLPEESCGSASCVGGGDDGPVSYLPGWVLAAPTFLDPQHGFVAVVTLTESASAVHYFQTEDGGLTWTEAGRLNEQVRSLPAFTDATHWFQPVIGAEVIRKTADGGKSWTAVGGKGLPTGTPIECLWMADANHGAALGMIPDTDFLFALFLTSDGGRSWAAADFAAR